MERLFLCSIDKPLLPVPEIVLPLQSKVRSLAIIFSPLAVHPVIDEDKVVLSEILSSQV